MNHPLVVSRFYSKIILFGEHSVVYKGNRSILIPMPQRIVATSELLVDSNKFYFVEKIWCQDKDPAVLITSKYLSNKARDIVSWDKLLLKDYLEKNPEVDQLLEKKRRGQFFFTAQPYHLSFISKKYLGTEIHSHIITKYD